MKCKKERDCRMNINSPDFVQKQSLKENLAIGDQKLYALNGVKKNDMRMLWTYSSEFLRPQKKAYSRFILWRSANLSGSGNSASFVPKERKSEARETAMAIGKFILYKAFCCFSGKEMPNSNNFGCSKRIAYGLENREGYGQILHGGTATKSPEDKSKSNRSRRNCYSQGTYLSHSGERFRKGSSNLVWWKRSIRGKHGYVLSEPWRKKKQENRISGNGYVEGVREIDQKECSASRNTLRQVSCDETSWESIGHNPQARVFKAFRQEPQIYQRAEIYFAVQSREPNPRRESLSAVAYESKQTATNSIFTEGVVWSIVGLPIRRLGSKVFRELEKFTQMAKAKTLRRFYKADRKALGWNCSSLQHEAQSIIGFCGRAQQQNPSYSTESVWIERRGLFTAENLNLYVGCEIN